MGEKSLKSLFFLLILVVNNSRWNLCDFNVFNVYYKDVKLHVFILCTPQPPVMCRCHVMCSHPPKAWVSHHVVGYRVCQEVCVVSVGLGKQVWFKVFIWVYFCCHHSTQHRSETMFLGNAAQPPSFSPNPHALHSYHTHIRRANTHPVASFPPLLIHVVHIQKPSHSHRKPTHPLIPPSFFRSTGLSESFGRRPQHTLSVGGFSAPPSSSRPAPHETDPQSGDSLPSEASQFRTCDVWQLLGNEHTPQQRSPVIGRSLPEGQIPERSRRRLKGKPTNSRPHRDPCTPSLEHTCKYSAEVEDVLVWMLSELQLVWSVVVLVFQCFVRL